MCPPPLNSPTGASKPHFYRAGGRWVVYRRVLGAHLYGQGLTVREAWNDMIKAQRMYCEAAGA